MTEQRAQPEVQPDPFALWRQLYEANEQAWTKAMKDVLTSPSYAEAQGKMLEIFLSYQKVMRDAMSAQLTSLNLPTRDDVSRLGELVVGLEEKVDQLADALAGVQDELNRPADALAGVEGKLDQLASRFTSLEGRLAQPNGRIGDRFDQLDRRLAGIERQLTQPAPAAEPPSPEPAPERPARGRGRGRQAQPAGDVAVPASVDPTAAQTELGPIDALAEHEREHTE